MEPNSRRSSRVRLIAFSALVLGIAAIGTGLTSLAIFTDRQDVTSNGFQTGTIKISVTPTTAFFSVPNMMPGDVYSTPVTVANVGSSQLKFDISSFNPTGTGNLQNQIDLAIGQMPAANCSTWDGTGAPLLGAAKLATVSVTGRVLNALGQGGDTTVLCFRASLPLNTLDAYQNQTASTTFRFDAQQTIHNP